MESVKGGALAKLNEEAESILKAAAPDRSIASWAMRFLKDLDGVIACLSGMSSYEQAVDNIDTMKNAGPLSDAEKEALRKALLSFRNSAVVKPETIEKYKGFTWHSASASGLCQLSASAQSLFCGRAQFLQQCASGKRSEENFRKKKSFWRTGQTEAGLSEMLRNG